MRARRTAGNDADFAGAQRRLNAKKLELERAGLKV
jgi:hypothetical protein